MGAVDACRKIGFLKNQMKQILVDQSRKKVPRKQNFNQLPIITGYESRKYFQLFEAVWQNLEYHFVLFWKMFANVSRYAGVLITFKSVT